MCFVTLTAFKGDVVKAMNIKQGFGDLTEVLGLKIILPV